MTENIPKLSIGLRLALFKEKGVLMGNKGLCITCLFDKGCVFPRKTPVLFCEEFSDYQQRVKAANYCCDAKSRTNCSEQETAESSE